MTTSTDQRARPASAPDPVTTLDCLIVGAGFAGIGAAVKLREAGVTDLLILDAGDEVGGTWRDNTYPGAACDVPSHLYSFSFAPKSDWSCAYAEQHEILDYLVEVTDEFGLRPYLRLGRHVDEARWDETDLRWHVTCDTGERFVARTLIGAIGSLRDPAYPAIPGREEFAGTSMHTARWDHEVELEGKRVGIIGTGASAIQVVPSIAEDVGRLTLFQRTPPWVLPRHQRAYTDLEKALLARVPGLQKLYRWRIYLQKEARFLGFGPLGDTIMRPVERRAKRYLRKRVADPTLQRTLTPGYRMGCKRILISDDYHDAVARPDVALVTDGIERITPSGVVTTDGTEHELDVLVFATGFQIRRPLGGLTVVGTGGRDLSETWGARPVAYLGMSVSGFPNFAIVAGPNSGLGHNSMVFVIESQLEHVVGAVRTALRPEIAYVDVRPEVVDAFEAEVDRRNANSVWATGCESWYLGEDGVNFTLWPGSTVELRWRTRRFDPVAYDLVTRDRHEATVGGHERRAHASA